MIPIREAIETGAWLKAECESCNGSDEYALGEFAKFRLRVTGFDKIDLSKVDGREELRCEMDSNIWRLSLDVVNLCKKEMSIDVVVDRLFLADQEGFQFKVFKDPTLRCCSNYAKTSRLRDFFAERLPPKIKKSGALPYELPDEFDKMFLIIRGGTLAEA